MLEFLRLDPSPVAGLNVNQTFMLVVALVAAAALIIRHRFTSGEEAQPVVPTATSNPIPPVRDVGKSEEEGSGQDSGLANPDK